MPEKTIKLKHGDGGTPMSDLISGIRQSLEFTGDWKGTHDDGAYLKAGDKYLVFTSDSYIQSPYFFPGGNIGKLAVTGTVNDLVVMGAEPLALTLSIIIEEGFKKEHLETIIDSVNTLSKKLKVPIVTGDTKVMPKGQLDGIVINTAGIGTTKDIIKNENIAPTDKVIVTGTVGDHGGAILATRFDYKTDLVSDCKPVLDIIRLVKGKIKSAKDPTRGGIASCLNELADKAKVRITIDEETIPIRKETRAICNILGIDPLTLACEGRALLIVSEDDEKKVLELLKKDLCLDAITIGTVSKGKKVILKTKIGERFLDNPGGTGVPRIC